jgi:hypothetical protein
LDRTAHQPSESRPASRPAAVWWICLGAILILFLNLGRSVPLIAELLVSGDGDDLMRLQQVRDWLGGQSWFDTQQYRILPPEGISIHWSRYVDLGIAAFLVPASWVLPATQAELAAIMLWPTFLACLAVLVIGHGANRLMGPAAAIGALVVFLTWGKLGGEFASGRIDHHNVQILCATTVFYLSLVPGRRWLLGTAAGTVTALALAVGLEMLPFFALLWGMVVLRHAFADPGTGPWLVGFCLAFAVAAPLFLVGQTPMSGWWVNHCDVLAPPVLTLAAVGIAATLAQVALGRVLRHPLARLALSAAIVAGGLWLAAPLLLPCLAGPYAQASAEVRLIIETQVNEALPASILIQSRPELLFRVIMPPIIITALALGVAWRMQDRIGRPLAIALAQSVAVVLVGLAFALIQIRAANLMTPAVPLLGGFLVHAFAAIPKESRLRAPAALALVLAVPAVVEAGSRAIAGPPELPPPPVAGDTGPQAPGAISLAYCRTETALAEIASLPASLVFASLNIGPAILVYTPHATTSAGYHRSAAAYWNGVGAFQGRKELRDALAASGADHLVICVGAGEERVITAMTAAGWPDWLIEVTGDRRSLRAFRIDKAALARDSAAP